MRKTIIKILTMIMAIAILPTFVFAANEVTINGIVNFQLLTADTAAAATILASGGGQVTNFDVQTNYIDITLDNLSTVTFDTTAAGQYFRVTKQSGSNDYTIIKNCPLTHIVMTGTGAQVVLRLEVITTYAACPSGTAASALYPTNYSASINNGASQTTSTSVNLSLQAENAAYVIISNNSNFTGSDWQIFVSPATMPWTLESGDGEKTVYVLYKTSTGNLSTIISDAIVLAAPIAPPTPPEEPGEEPVTPPTQTGGCDADCGKIGYELYIVNPNGTVRSMNSGYVKTVDMGNGAKDYYFEDSDSDFDYNDIVIRVTKNKCIVSVITTALDAGWHHQIKLKFYFNGTLKEDILVFADSLQSLNQLKQYDINDYPDICAEGLVEPEQPAETKALLSGDLIKNSLAAVYYYASDLMRHVFPNRNTYMTHYKDFSNLKLLSDSQMASIPLGANMTYKPGARMIKIQTDPKVYAVDEGAMLRWVTTEQVAADLYGPNWNKYIDDLSDAFFTDYAIGDPIYSAADYAIDLSEYITEQPIAPASVTESLQPTSSCASSIKFTINMDVGSTGEQVTALQTILKCLGYYPADFDITGYYGEVTKNSVLKFQADNGIDQTGAVGPITRQTLNKYYND